MLDIYDTNYTGASKIQRCPLKMVFGEGKEDNLFYVFNLLKGVAVVPAMVHVLYGTDLLRICPRSRGAGCVGSAEILAAHFLTLDLYKSWIEGSSALMILSADLIVRCSLDLSYLVDEPNHTEMDEDRTD
ncbi:hypothetical protein AMECASPLE_005781 [Ameca splendens]|uniref:Uncharacterized protein n=1 Tax=Ameca splendens TaxID=208324 RepID=A0ABV1A6C3_9TELE